MTNAANIAETEETDTTLSWDQLWMLPLILFHVICELFSNHVAHFKQLRRTRPMPKGWEELIEPLREAEWPVVSLRTEGARRILAGQPLDLASIVLTDPDPGQGWTEPRSAQAVHLRTLYVLKFTSNPEPYIRRHAARIARREAAKAAATTTIAPQACRPAAPPTATTTIAPLRRRAGMRVRAPPWLTKRAAKTPRPRPADHQRGRGRLCVTGQA